MTGVSTAKKVWTQLSGQCIEAEVYALEACLEPYAITGADQTSEDEGGRRRSKIESGPNSLAGVSEKKKSPEDTL